MRLGDVEFENQELGCGKLGLEIIKNLRLAESGNGNITLAEDIFDHGTAESRRRTSDCNTIIQNPCMVKKEVNTVAYQTRLEE